MNGDSYSAFQAAAELPDREQDELPPSQAEQDADWLETCILGPLSMNDEEAAATLRILQRLREPVAASQGEAEREPVAKYRAALVQPVPDSADTRRLDYIDTLQDALLNLRDPETSDQHTVWWRMPDRMRDQGYTNSTAIPIRMFIDAALDRASASAPTTEKA